MSRGLYILLLYSTFSSLNFPSSVVNLFSWLGKLTPHRRHIGKKEHGCRPRASVCGDTSLASVIFSGRRRMWQGDLLGAVLGSYSILHLLSLSWESLTFYSQPLPCSPSTLNLLSLLLLLQITHILFSSVPLSFSLLKLSSFRYSQQCPSCYHVHLSYPSLRPFCSSYLLFYMNATFSDLHCQSSVLNIYF